jgi:hypothetical protein
MKWLFPGFVCGGGVKCAGVRDRSKTIQFWLEDPVGALKGRIEARQGHRRDAGEDHLTQF